MGWDRRAAGGPGHRHVGGARGGRRQLAVVGLRSPPAGRPARDESSRRGGQHGVLQDLTNADAGIRGWATTGDQASLCLLRRTDERPANSAPRAVRAADAVHRRAPEYQEDAIDASFAAYVEPRLEPPGPEERHLARFVPGGVRSTPSGRRTPHRPRAGHLGPGRACPARGPGTPWSSWWSRCARAVGAPRLARSFAGAIQRPLVGPPTWSSGSRRGSTACGPTDGLREVAAVGDARQPARRREPAGREVEADVHSRSESSTAPERLRLQRVPRAAHAAHQHQGLPRAARGRRRRLDAPSARCRGGRPQRRPAQPADRGPAGALQGRVARHPADASTSAAW